MAAPLSDEIANMLRSDVPTHPSTGLPRLSLGALGGTVSMIQGAQGAVPALDSTGQLAHLADGSLLAEIHSETLCLLPSASLSFTLLLQVLDWARAQVAQGAVAVVLTQGTDSLEEVAWFLDLLWDLPEPLVLTGAMRNASQPGPDGPANLLAAIRVSLAPASRERGVLVVMNERIHGARWVRKVDSMALDAFASPDRGAQGHVYEEHVEYYVPAAPRQALPRPARSDQRIALLPVSLDAAPELIPLLLETSCDGLVIAGFGAGHVPGSWVYWLEQASRRMPVLMATRTGKGSTAFDTYGFSGGEIDLQRHGVVMAGSLCPYKCRVLLWLLVGSGCLDRLQAYLQPQYSR